MEMTGRQRIEAAREAVWAALNDPDVLKQCIPGCQSLEKTAEDRMKAVAGIKVGPIGARFTGDVTLSELDPPNGYRITGEGQGGPAGFAKGGARVALEADGDATLLVYEVEAQVGGRLAQLGGPIIDATAKQMAATFFRKFSEIVAQPVADRSAADASPATSSVSVPTAGPIAATGAPGLPVAWVLAVIVAALAGVLIGRGGGEVGASGWAGLAIGLLVVVVAAAAFEFGRRSAQPVLMLDPRVLARLAGEEPQR